MKPKITLKELAKLLNVSVSTVSKALHDSSEISPKTVERVKELAALHNYRPNPTAVNLKSSRSGNIAVIVPNITNSFFARVLDGVEVKARELGFQLITYISHESLKIEKQITEIISNGIADGVLISLSEETQKTKNYDHIYKLIDYDIPVVLYDRINVDIDLDKIGVNDFASIYDAVEMLQSSGIKKIGLVNSITNLGVGQQRMEGFKKACLDFNLPITKEFYIISDESEVLTKKLNALLFKEEMQAFICLDFLSTILTSRVVQENKRNIPEDVKLIGYVTEEIAPFIYPSISYIDQHPVKLGEMATEFLVKRIKDYSANFKGSETIINTKLIHLDSTRF